MNKNHFLLENVVTKKIMEVFNLMDSKKNKLSNESFDGYHGALIMLYKQFDMNERYWYCISFKNKRKYKKNILEAIEHIKDEIDFIG